MIKPIAAVLTLALAGCVTTSARPPDSNMEAKLKDTMREFRNCVLYRADVYAKGTAEPEIIAEAAMADCAPEAERTRQLAEAYMLSTATRTNRDYALSLSHKLNLEIWHDNRRAAMSRVLKARM